MSERTMIEGIEVSMGGRKWIVPPLTLGQVKRLAPNIAAMASNQEELDPAAVGAVCKVLHAALSRNYPELKLDTVFDDEGKMVGEPGVDELLDMGNVVKVTRALMGGSGLVPSGEATGEATKR